MNSWQQQAADRQALIAGRYFVTKEPQSQLAKEYGVSRPCVSRYVSNHETGAMREKAIEAARNFIESQQSLAHAPESLGDATAQNAAPEAPVASGALGDAERESPGPSAESAADRVIEQRIRAFEKIEVIGNRAVPPYPA